ncbi:MAG TPA: serine/threonine-protein kinase, partial [Urbifossiella sp.]|nr:serine/threonine-protein kinase [Urbifossiella sp.]
MTPSAPNSPETPSHPSPAGPDSLLLASYCRQLEAARRDGKAVSPTDLCVDRPDLLPDLLRAIDVLGVMGADPTVVAVGGETANVPADLPTLPGYDLVGEIGRGGMGVVYTARHRTLNRVVAIKLIADAGTAAASSLARFRQEAAAVARLQHPNIVQIFETGVTGGRPFLALEYVDGGTLRQRTAGVPQPPRDAARLVETVSRAVHHAHEHRIIHRDLKPANILLTAGGVPKVADFGLARSLDAGGGLTLTADFAGTPAYAAPEQLHNRPAGVGPWTDIYGLGATLYELLAGRPPFDTASLPELLRQVADQDPTPPRRLRPDCPRDLETICQKCLEKNPARRYPSALALADDLRRFLADEPILARPIGPVGRGWRWAKRNPTVAGLVVAIGLGLTAAAAGGAVLSSSLAAALNAAEQDRDRAVRAEAAGQRKLFAAYVSEANAVRATGRPGQRFLALDKIRQALALGGPDDLTPADRLTARNAAAAALCQPDLCPGPDWDAAAPAAGVPPGTAARARALRFRPPDAGVPEPVRLVGPAGRFAVLAPRTWVVLADNPFEVWRLDGPEPGRVFADPAGIYQQACAFSPDERKLAVGRRDGTVTVFATADGRELTRFPAGAGHMWGLEWHPDSAKLAVVLGDESQAWDDQRVWDTAATPPAVWATVRHPLATGHVAFHPAGRVLATAGSDGLLRLWELPTGRPVAGWKSRLGSGTHIAFSPGGDLIAGTDWANVQRIWDAGTGRELAHLTHGNGSPVFTAAGRSGNPSLHEGRYYDCRVSAGRERRVLNRPAADGFEPAVWAAPHPDGRLLAVSAAGGVAFVDLATGRTVATAPCGDPYWLRFDARGALWTNCGGGGNVPLLRWPVTADPAAPHRLTVGPPEYAATGTTGDAYSTSADGRVVAVPRRAYGAQVVRPGPAATVRTFGPHLDVRSTTLSPDGRLLATTSFHADDGSDIRVKVWDVAAGRHVAS